MNMEFQSSKNSDHPAGAFKTVWAALGVLTACATLSYLIFKVTGGDRFYLSSRTVLLHFIPPVLALVIMALPRSAEHAFSKAGTWFSIHTGRLLWLYGILTFLSLLLVNRWILHSFMNSADEHSCWFLANLFLEGKIWKEAPLMKEFFETPHVGILDGKWFSVYPPGWPLLWAAGIAAGMPHAVNPLILAAATSFFLKTAKDLFGAPAAHLCFLILIASPFYLFTGAAYYSHNTSFLFIALFYFACLRWKQTSSAWWAGTAGAVLGYGLAARYLSAAASAVPFFLWLPAAFKRGGIKIRYVFIFFMTLGFITAFHLCFNALITGSPLDPPNHYLHSHEKLGFIAGYTPLTAFEYLWRRTLYLIDWTPPFMVPFFFAATAAAVISRRARAAACSLAALGVMAAYMLYYSWGGNQYGPRYYFEAYPFMVLAVSSEAVRLWGRASPAVRKASAGILLGSIIASVGIFQHHAAYFSRVSSERKQVYDTARAAAVKPALVFMRGFMGDALVMSEEDAVRNSPSLEKQSIVYAHDLKERNSELCRLWPERETYYAYYDRSAKQARIEHFNCQKAAVSSS